MTRRNPERPPGPSYYRLPEASWTMIRDEYLSGWTAKEIGKKWRVSPTSVYRHASDGGWNKYARGQAFHDQIVAEAAAEDRRGPPQDRAEGPPEEIPWSWKASPEGLRQGSRPLPGMWGPPPKRVWQEPAGYGPMPPHLVPPVPRPPEPPEDEAEPSPAEAAEQVAAAAARAAATGRYDEAERLGRLAATLQKLGGQKLGGQKLGGAAKAKGAAAFRPVEEDQADEVEETPEGDRPLNCTMNTCAVQKIYQRAREATALVFERANMPLGEDIEAWAAMGEAMQARIEPEVAELAAAFRATGMAGLHGRLGALLGPPPPRRSLEPWEPFRPG